MKLDNCEYFMVNLRYSDLFFDIRFSKRQYKGRTMLCSQLIYAPSVDRSHQVFVHLVFGILLALGVFDEA